MWHQGHMHILRSFFALFLVLVLLPWGAFAKQMPTGRTAPQSALVQDWAAGHEASATVRSDAKLVSTKHCRGPVLPGSACNPVLGLLPEASAVAGTQRLAHPRASADLSAIGRDPSPPLGPPRSC